MSVSVSVYKITQNGSNNLKLEHNVVYENSSEEFDLWHGPIKVKISVKFSPFTTIQTLNSCILALVHVRK